MSTYSLGGYRIAVLNRSKKTLVVEGRSDYLVLHRFLLEVAENDASFTIPLIDTADLVRDDDLSGLGARDRVERILQFVGAAEGKAAGLIDREWDGFCIRTFEADVERVSAPPIYVTKGHSIENYFFHVDVCLEFIRRRFAEFSSPAFLGLVQGEFIRILRFAFVYSMSAARWGVIDRAEGLLAPVDVTWNGQRFGIADSFAPKLRARGLTRCKSEEFVDSIESLYVEIDGRMLAEGLDRWNSHGHLGDSAIWACVGRLASANGMSIDSANNLAFGFKEEKLRSSADFTAKANVRDIVPFGLMLEWART